MEKPRKLSRVMSAAALVIVVDLIVLFAVLAFFCGFALEAVR